MFADGGRVMLEWFETRLITVFGQGDPAEQTATSLLLAVVTWSTTVITLGVSIILALIFTGTFLWGLYRLVTEGPGGGS
jgi:hypothetical protein